MRTKMITANIFVATEDRSKDPCDICGGSIRPSSVFVYLPASKLEVDICTDCARTIGRAARSVEVKVHEDRCKENPCES